jgi:hypothetical protein
MELYPSQLTTDAGGWVAAPNFLALFLVAFDKSDATQSRLSFLRMRHQPDVPRATPPVSVTVSFNSSRMSSD